MPISWRRGKSAKTQGPGCCSALRPRSLPWQLSVWPTAAPERTSPPAAKLGAVFQVSRGEIWGAVLVPAHQPPNSGYLAGAVPDAHKSRDAAEWVTWLLWLLGKCESYVDTIQCTMCTMALYLTVIYRLHIYDHHLSLQQVHNPCVNIKDHWLQITVTNIRQELPRYARDTKWANAVGKIATDLLNAGLTEDFHL